MSKAGAETPPGTRFAIVATDAGMRGLAIEWFPTISGRISLGTHMGLEWTNRDRFMNTRALDREFQEGRFPSEVDAVFTIGPAGATWTMGR
jgi:hypothetical protein